MRPLDLSEFLQWLYMHACRYPGTLCDGAADFALEAIELADTGVTEEYWALRDDLERQAGKEFEEDFRLVEHFTDRDNLLTEIEEKLGEFKFPDEFQSSDTADKVEYLLALVDDLRTENEALKAPAVASPLEYDL